MSKGSGDRHLHRGPAGEPGRGLIYQGLRKTEGSGNTACLLWGSVRGIWREGSFNGDPEGYAKQGSGNGCLFP
jgi:hypothetical protein